jgi:glutamate synthase (NADPH/NADH) small chain
MKKTAIQPQELQHVDRTKSFDEVVLGYTEEEAVSEASRCLQCRSPVCISGCPVGIDIKRFIHRISQRDYEGAYLAIREKNSFPSICGRVCPAEYQCRKACVLTEKDSRFASKEAINIHFLERFAGDFGMVHKMNGMLEKKQKLSHHKVAVIGAGPAGLSCAEGLARHGVQVVVFESLHKPGGVLRYGIPSFRLPRAILDYEISVLMKLGVNIIPNFVAGPLRSLEEFFAGGYRTIFLGLGAGTPSFLGLKGETLCNIYSANEFLTRLNLMSAYEFPDYHTPVNVGKHIVVIGGGNTAMDAARAAYRLQKIRGVSPCVTVLYRRSELEMPARRIEIEHAKEEGIRFHFLVQPIEFLRGEAGFVKKVRCLKCRLGEPDASGRQRSVVIEGSEFELDCDLSIIAAGLKANQVLTKVTPDLKIDKAGDVVVDVETMETSIKGVFAGGDIVGGEGTVIEAMGMARKASEAILERFKKLRF